MNPNASADVFLADEELTMLLRHGDREVATTRLRLYMSIVRRTDTSREIFVRVTDKSDAFFLYTMRLGEEEYGRFKELHSLNVDFSTFPRFVERLAKGDATRQSVEMSTEGGKGTLRFMETNEFRNIENLSIVLSQESDVGQKRYLSECLKASEAALDVSRRHAEDTESRLRAELAGLTADVAALREYKERSASRHQHEMSEVTSSRATDVAVLRETHAQDRQRWTEDRAALERAQEKDLRLVREQLSAAQSHAMDFGMQVQALTSREASAASEVRVLRETEALTAKELSVTKGTNLSLTAERGEQERSLADVRQRLAMVQHTLASKEENIAGRDAQVKELQRERETQSAVLEGTMRQCRDLEARAATQEGALKKCHHILQTMRDAVDREKERRASAESRAGTLERTLSEKGALVEQVRGGAMVMEERLRGAHAERDALAEQLRDGQSKLQAATAQLAERDNTVVYLQRQMNNVGLHAGTGGMRTAIPPPVPGGSAMFQAFSRNEWKAPPSEGTGSFSVVAPITPPVSIHGRHTVDPRSATTPYRPEGPGKSYIAVGVASTALQPSAYFPMAAS